MKARVESCRANCLILILMLKACCQRTSLSCFSSIKKFEQFCCEPARYKRRIIPSSRSICGTERKVATSLRCGYNRKHICGDIAFNQLLNFRFNCCAYSHLHPLTTLRGGATFRIVGTRLTLRFNMGTFALNIESNILNFEILPPSDSGDCP
jgi:hypothetical protein